MQPERKKYNYLQLPGQTQPVLGLSTRKTINSNEPNHSVLAASSCNKLDASAQRM